MPGPISEITVRRQTGIQRKKQAKAARKRLRLRGARRPKRLTAKQKASVRKRKGMGFYKKIARLRSSLDLPATITGSISHRPEYIDLVLEVAAEFEDEKQDARAFARLFIEKDPAFSNTDTGLAAILFEAFVFERGEDIVQQFLETQLEGPDTTFLAIFEGKIEDEALQKLLLGVRDICTFDPLVRAGDTSHKDGTVSDVTILECTPKRQKKSKAAVQQPEPALRTEGLLPQTKADYEAVLDEGGISDNAFMYLYPTVWEAAKGNNGDIRTATETTGVRWYCNEGVWLPDIESLDEQDLDEAQGPKSRKVGGIKLTFKEHGLADYGQKALRDRLKQFKHGWNVTLDLLDPQGEVGHVTLTVKGGKLVVSGRDPKNLSRTLKEPRPVKSPLTVVYAPATKGLGTPGQYEDLDEAQKFKTAEQVRDHFFDKKKGYKVKIAGHTVTVVKASVQGRPVTLRWTGKKKGSGFVTDFLDAVDPNDKKFPSGGASESIDEAYMLAANVKAHGKTYPKGKTVTVVKKTKQGYQVELEPGVETHVLAKEIKKFTPKAPANEAFTATFPDTTRANRFARECRAHARTIRPKGLTVHYEAKEADHTQETTHQEEIDELCRKHGGKKTKKKKPIKEEEDSHAIVAGPFCGDGEARPIHNGHCEVIGFTGPLQAGPLYLENEEGFQSKFLSWTIRKEDTDDGKILVNVRDSTYRLPITLSEVKGLLDKMEEFYEDLPDEFDVMVQAYFEEYAEASVESGLGEKLCLEDIESLDLTEALEGWSSHDFIVGRDSRITARSRLRRLALGEDATTLMDVKGGRVSFRGTRFMCLECGEHWRGRAGPKTFEIKCPKCGSYETGPSERADGFDIVSTLHEAKKYVIRTEKGKKADVLQAIRKRDKTAKVDPEGNPQTAWVTTKLAVRDLRAMAGVKDAVETTSITGFKESETCTVEIIAAADVQHGTDEHAHDHLFIDEEDMGHVDEVTMSTMVPIFQAAGLGTIKVGEKATTRVVKCPDCGGKVLAATGYCVACKKKTIKESVEEGTITVRFPSSAGLDAATKEMDKSGKIKTSSFDANPKRRGKQIVATLRFKASEMGEVIPLIKRHGGVPESVDEAKGRWSALFRDKKKARKFVEAVEAKFPRATGPIQAPVAGQYYVPWETSLRKHDDVIKRIAKGMGGEPERRMYIESTDEAKYGLTLEKIRMGGEYQAFKVLKGKSLVGFLMQTGRNTATDEHPWKAFRVLRGQVGEKIGFYYKKDGGKSAALQAIAKTGLESVDDVEVLRDVFMRDEPNEIAAAVDDVIDEQVRVGDARIILPKGSKDYEAVTSVEIEVDNKTIATASRKSGGKKWTLKFKKKDVTASDKKKAQAAITAFHVKYVEDIAMLDGVELDEAISTVYAKLVPTTDRMALEKKDTAIFSDKAAKKEIARFPWHHTSKPGAKATTVVINGVRRKLVWLGEGEIVVHMDAEGNLIELRNATPNLVEAVGDLQRRLQAADENVEEDYRHGGYIYLAREIAPTAPKHQGKSVIYRKKGAWVAAPREVWTGSKWVSGKLADMEDKAKKYANKRTAVADLRKVAEDIGEAATTARTVAGVKITFEPHKLAHQGKEVVKDRMQALMRKARKGFGATVTVDLSDPKGEVAAVRLKQEEGKLFVTDRDPKNLFQKLKKWRLVKGELTAVYKGTTESEDVDEVLRIKRRNVEALRAFTVFASADSKVEAAGFKKALKGTSFHRGGGLFFHKTANAKHVEFTILGGMRDTDEVLDVLQDITGTSITLENYEITQLEGAKLDEAREAMTTKVPGVGKVTEPTHMKALARKAGKSAKAALELWGRAQAAANKQYPELKAAKGAGGEKERRYYKVVTSIFKNMLGLGKEECEQSDPIVAEVLCHSCRSTTEVFLWPHNVGVCGECNGEHITPTGEMHYASDEEVEAADPALLEAVSIGTPPDMMHNWNVMEAVIWCDGRKEANKVKKALGKHFGYYKSRGMLGGLIKGAKVSESGFKARVVVNTNVTVDQFLGGLKDAILKAGVQVKGHAFECKNIGTVADYNFDE